MTQPYLKLVLFLILFSGISNFCVQAQDKPVFHQYSFDDNAIITNLSNNGSWAVAVGSNTENPMLSAGPKLIEISTDAVTNLLDGYDESSVSSANATDVTDDGNMVVGSFNGKPAYWSRASRLWIQLPIKNTWESGVIRGVTPDGKYGVGVQFSGDGYSAEPALWDLTTNTLIETPGLPTKDMAHENKDQNQFDAISSDGKYILGCMSFSYWPTDLYLGGCFYYIYDTTTSTYTPIGFNETNSGRWTPLAEGLFLVGSASLSPSGNWVTGMAHMVKDKAGSDFPEEYEVAYTYNIKENAFKVYDEREDIDLTGMSIDNEGNVFAASPSSSPIREWSIRKGKYWYSIVQILKQQYGIDFYEKTGYDNTGTPISVSDDGKKVAVFPDPYTSYVLELPVSFAQACEGINLFGSYLVTPAAGSTISKLKTIQLTFDRNVSVTGSATSVEIRNASGLKVYSSVGFSANNKTVSIRFRSGALSAGEQYTLHIPANTLALANDATQTNDEINIPYNGREDKPVAATAIYPANGTAFAKIDYSTSPILLTFDTDVLVQDTAKAYLYRNEEADAYCPLLLAYSGNQVALYPATIQYLFKGSNYRVEISAGSITDVAGNNGNEVITIDYQGSYEREISYDDKYLFKDNFDNGLNNFMVYDGDQLTPAEAPVGWGFQSNYGWWLCADDDNRADLAAASHSMYKPAGKSNDWLVIPQLYIPDDKCCLTFDSQSYLKSKTDRLKVYIWANDNVYNTINEEITQRIKAEGVLKYNEIQSPGEKEDILAGDWAENVIDLAEFAGKNIYIAFVNDDENQSAVFIENVAVEHNMSLLVAFTNDPTVVNKENIIISGRITIDNNIKTYTSVSLTLKDKEGTVIDKIEQSGLSLSNGDSYPFQFNKPLPLTIGIANQFTIDATLDDEEYTLSGTVKNLAFQPTKHVVLEEFSGRQCGNCPLGILAVEHIKQQFGDLFIPIAIHTYGDDPLGVGLSSYSGFVVGQSGAPSGVINRCGVVSFPAVSDANKDYHFTKATVPAETDKLWYDYVADELSVAADADIDIAPVYDEEKNEFTVPCTVRYALNTDNLNVSIFLVLLEDNVLGYQFNYMASQTSPTLGEWGKGGIYGQSVVYDYPNMDVCRAYAGLTFNGTGGYIPQQVTAGTEYKATLKMPVPATISNIKNCKIVAMMIDANTNKVINATIARDNTGIHHIEANSEISIVSANRSIIVNTPKEASVSVYGVNGTLLDARKGNGEITISLPGHTGVAIVKVVTDNSTTVKKVLVK